MHVPKLTHCGILFCFAQKNNRGKVAVKKLQKVSTPENQATPNLAENPKRWKVKYVNYASFLMIVLFEMAKCFLLPERSKAKSILPKTIPPHEAWFTITCFPALFF